MTAMPEHVFEREVRRVFRRFVEPQCCAKRVNDTEFGLFVSRNAWRKPVLLIGEDLWTLFERRDLVRAADETVSPIVWYPSEDRKSVVSGKSVSVRVDIGGRRTIKKKKNE